MKKKLVRRIHRVVSLLSVLTVLFAFSHRANAAITGPASVTFTNVRFSDTAFTATTSTNTITIANGSGTAVSVGATDVVFSNAAFSLVSPALPVLIPANGNVVFTVQFNPTAAGLVNATVTFTDDQMGDQAVVNLAGTGTTAVLDSNPAAVNFGIVNAGGSSANRTVTMTRIAGGNGPLTVRKVQFTGGDATAFTALSVAGMSCSGQTCTSAGITVSTGTVINFKCTVPAAATADLTTMLTIESDSDPVPVDTIPITCTPGYAAIALNVANLDFAGVPVTTSDSMNIMVTNNGNIALNVSVSKSGANAADFTVPASLVVSANATVALGVTFTPAARGARVATVTLTTNDGANPTVDVPVNGVGQAPQISPAPTNIAFGNVLVGDMSVATDVVVTNSGELNLNVTGATIATGATEFTITDAPANTTIAAATSKTWKVVCNPTARGLRNGTLRFTSNSITNPTFDIPLTCNGLQASISIAPATHTYLPRFVGATDSRTFTITNNGDVALTTVALDFASATNAFTVSAAPSTTLAVNATTTATVVFNPADAGFKSVNLSLTTTEGASATAALSGQGLDYTVTNTGAQLLPAAKRFDDINAAGTLVVTNTSAVAITIGSVTFTPSGMTVAGDLVINPADQAFTLSAGATKVIRITLPTSLNRMGPSSITGMVSVNGINAGTRTQNFPIAIASTSANVTFTDEANNDFGTVDIDVTPNSMRTLTITNLATATAGLDFSAATLVQVPSGPPLSGAFVLEAGPGPGALTPGASQNFVIRYQPNLPNPAVTRPPGEFDQALVRVVIKGDFQRPMPVDFIVKAHPIDRKLRDLPAQLDFPETFTYPGDLASVQTINIENLGEAELTFNVELRDASAAWSLDRDTTDVIVPAFGTVPVKIKFSPFNTTKQTATVVIRHNDNGTSPVGPRYERLIQLDETGHNRNVNFTKGKITFDPSPAGVSVQLSANADGELATLINHETGFAFRISNVEVIGDSAFSVIDGAVDQMIMPGMTSGIDLQFSPPTTGEYHATLRVYFDGAPVATSEIAVTATAVETKLIGGAGCQTSRGSHSAWLLVAAVLLAVRRRRTSAAAIAVAAAGAVQASSAVADVPQSKNLEISLFRATPSSSTRFLHTESAQAGRSGDWSMQLVVSHETNPLVADINDGLMRSTALISRRSTFEIGAAYSFLSRFEAAVRMPMYVQDGNDAALRGLTGVSGTAIGDLSLHFKGTALERKNFALALSTMLTLPTAKNDQLAGVSNPSGLVRALATIHSGPISLGGNAGVWIRSKTQFASVQGSELAFGVAAAYRVNRDLSAVVDGFGTKSLVSGATAAQSTLVAMAGVRYHVLANLDVSAAVGRGLVNGPGTPSVLATVLLGYASRPAYLDAKKVPRVIGDRDNDGVRDNADQCVDTPEDVDNFDDADGCPDLDNDKDLVDDAADKCPLAAEDVDSFEDSDGCPDLDNDSDGVADRMDKCPNQAEDKDGFADADGCPEPDNDNDGIDDGVDKCPAAAETINGKNDQDGCPDEGDAAVVMSADRIELFESVSFSGATLTRASTNVLGQVAALLRAHKDVKRLRIISHVNERNGKDNELTQKRADAIRDWLVQWGIAASRLEARGFGSTKMLVLPSSKNANSINDRIELVIMEHE